MNSAPISCLALLATLASTTISHTRDWLTVMPATQAELAAELQDSAAPVVDSAPAEQGRVRRSADGMFYVHARVNGAKVRFLVDTGASHTVLTKADAARIGVRPKKGRAIVTAAGPVRFSWTTLNKVSLAGREMAGARAAVSDNRLPVSLLGQDMLSRFESVTMSGDSLWLS